MKVGVIGIGYWGKKHVEEYHELGHDVTICDNDEENISACKEKFQFVNVESLDKLPNSQNPHINFSTTECGIKKCTYVRGMFNTSFGVACVNHLGRYTLENVTFLHDIANHHL